MVEIMRNTVMSIWWRYQIFVPLDEYFFGTIRNWPSICSIFLGHLTFGISSHQNVCSHLSRQPYMKESIKQLSDTHLTPSPPSTPTLPPSSLHTHNWNLEGFNPGQEDKNRYYTLSNGSALNEKALCVVDALDWSTKPIPLCSSSSSPSNKLNPRL